MSTGQRAVMLCGWGVKATMACLQVTLCAGIPERFGKCYSIQRRFTDVQVYLDYFTLPILSVGRQPDVELMMLIV